MQRPSSQRNRIRVHEVSKNSIPEIRNSGPKKVSQNLKKTKNDFIPETPRFSQSSRSPRRPLLLETAELPFTQRSPRPPRASAKSMRAPISPRPIHKLIPANPALRKFITSFESLSTIFRSFTKTNPTDYLDPRLLISFQDLGKAYKSFLNQATIHFSTLKHDQANKMSMKSSPLFQTSQTYLHAWVSFIEQISICESEGLAPHLGQLNDGFDTFFSCFAQIRQSMPTIRFKTDVGCVALEKLQNQIIKLRDDLSRIFFAPKDERFSTFDPLKFKMRMAQLMHQISDLFDRALLHSSLPISKTIPARTNMTSVLASISIIVNTARNYDIMFTNLKTHLVVMNERLTCLFKMMGFPYTVSIAFYDDDEKNEHIMNTSMMTPV